MHGIPQMTSTALEPTTSSHTDNTTVIHTNSHTAGSTQFLNSAQLLITHCIHVTSFHKGMHL